MNKVILTVYVLLVDEEKRQAFCRVDQKKQPLFCELQQEHLKLMKAGSTVVLQAELHSRDIVMRNPCDCNTTSGGVESYLVVQKVFLNETYCNEVMLDPVIAVQPGKLVCVLGKTFQSVRVRLPGDAGYATITIPDTKIIPAGTEFSISGTIRVKEYEKHAVCPCCKQEHVCTQLSLLVRGYLVK